MELLIALIVGLLVGASIAAMPLRGHLALLVSLAMPVAAWAVQPAHSIQPMEAGLQSLFDRMAEIRNEQRALIKRLDAASPETKVRIQADYQALESERQRIEGQIMRAA